MSNITRIKNNKEKKKVSNVNNVLQYYFINKLNFTSGKYLTFKLPNIEIQ